MNDYQNHTDEALLLSIQQGDEKAFAELFKRYWRIAHAITYSKVHNQQVTEEIVQDVFVVIWDKRASLSINNISAYLYTCLKNKALNYLESRMVQKKYWDYYKEFIPQTEKTTELELAHKELLVALEEGLKKLPIKTKNVFLLNRIEGKTIKEIANKLKLSEKAIEYHLTQSLKKLRLHLKDYILIFLTIINIVR